MLWPHGSAYPPPGYHHSYVYYHTWRLIRDISVWTFFASLASVLMPPKRWLRRWPRAYYAYEVFIIATAFIALNWRRRLPSLNVEILDEYHALARYLRRKRNASIKKRRRLTGIACRYVRGRFRGSKANNLP